MLTEAMQKELEEERNIQRLNNVLVNQIHHGIESGKVEKVPYGDYQFYVGEKYHQVISLIKSIII